MSLRKPAADKFYAQYGLMAEVGEYFDKLAKDRRDNRIPDPEARAKELGDILWFVAALAADEGWPLEVIAQMNLEKLFSRKERGVLSGSGDNR